jgi:hypothetical protein
MTQQTESPPFKGRPLVRKIATIMAEISRIPKRGRHSNLRYDYVQEADLMDLLRDRMADQGVVIFPSVRAHQMLESRDDRGRVNFLTTVTLEITMIDSESGDELTTTWIGQGMDAGDKGYYKAYTGAIKYFMLKTFLISTGDEATTPMPPPHERRPRQPGPEPPPHQEPPTTDHAPHHDADEAHETPLDKSPPHPEEEAAEPPQPAAQAQEAAPAEQAPQAPVEQLVEEEAPAIVETPAPVEDVVEEAAEEAPAPVEAAPVTEAAPQDDEDVEPPRKRPTQITADETDANAAAPPVAFSTDKLWQEIFEQLRGHLRGQKTLVRERFFATIAAARGLNHITELSPEQLAEELELIESLDGDARKAHLKDPAVASRPDSLSQQFMAAAQDAVPPEQVVALRRLYLDKMGATMLTEVDEPKLGAMVKKLNKMSGKERAAYIAQVLEGAGK